MFFTFLWPILYKNVNDCKEMDDIFSFIPINRTFSLNKKMIRLTPDQWRQLKVGAFLRPFVL
ncbi:hypothetical protein SG0102_09180 [Intestinibaculum porci]|uniref:Uncharacterized protein n=1 Tax=Intestinibaculum porci TaxID=2487118 RepID=A0A3G9JSZ9_9FIRM|nr:hypothetical protein SG0102_09180 [Intestinibaculum porci]